MNLLWKMHTLQNMASNNLQGALKGICEDISNLSQHSRKNAMHYHNSTTNINPNTFTVGNFDSVRTTKKLIYLFSVHLCRPKVNHKCEI